MKNKILGLVISLSLCASSIIGMTGCSSGDSKAATPVVQAQTQNQSKAPEGFITRNGNKLMDGDKEFRFISYNIPELSMQESPFWEIVDPYEQEDAIRTIAQMGCQVTRSYVFSVKGSNGKTPTHVEAPGKYNEECFKAFDNLLSLCNKYDVHIIVPFIDTWQWWGGIKELSAFRGKEDTDFWSDPQLKADYKDLVSHVLNRKNTITGVLYKDDPAILAWETGNELRNSPYYWISEMAEYIKSVDPNHLVIDGRDQYVMPESIDDPNIDILSNHYYGPNFVKRFKGDMEKINGKKPFIVGEFGLQNKTEIEGLINEIIKSDAAGGMIWSLRQHDAQGGFLWHSENASYSAYHWPGFSAGDLYDEKNMVNFIWEKAYEIRGLKKPALPAPEGTPVLLPIKTVSDIRWRGSTGAASYDVERATSATGNWTVVGKDISDSVADPTMIYKTDITDRFGVVHKNQEWRILFKDKTAKKGKTYYYRVKGKNSSGETAYSNIEKITVK